MSSRGSSILALLLAPAFSLAGDGFLGTKASPPVGPMQADTGGVGFMPFLQMVIALAIVLVVLKFVMPKLVTKLNKKLVTKVGSAIQIEESAAFAGGTLYVVNAKAKTLLLSVGSHGVTCLADLTAAPKPEPPSFEELVEKEVAGPLQPFAIVEAEQLEQPKSEIAGALERLQRLVG